MLGSTQEDLVSLPEIVGAFLRGPDHAVERNAHAFVFEVAGCGTKPHLGQRICPLPQTLLQITQVQLMLGGRWPQGSWKEKYPS